MEEIIHERCQQALSATRRNEIHETVRTNDAQRPRSRPRRRHRRLLPEIRIGANACFMGQPGSATVVTYHQGLRGI